MRSNTLCYLSLLQIWKLTQRCIRLATQIKSIASNVNFSKSTPPYSLDMTPSWLALWWSLRSDFVSCCLRFLYRLNLFLPQKDLLWLRLNNFLILLSSFWKTSTTWFIRFWSFDVDVHDSILCLLPSLSTFRTFFTSFTWSLPVKRCRCIFIFNICDIIVNHFRYCFLALYVIRFERDIVYLSGKFTQVSTASCSCVPMGIVSLRVMWI